VIDKMLNDSLNMELVAARKSKLRPSATTFGHLMNAYCETEQVRKARDLLQKMQWEGVRPNTPIFNMIIKGYALSGNLAGAEGKFLFHSQEPYFKNEMIDASAYYGDQG
jgi:pentatricopeptide repeat protein